MGPRVVSGAASQSRTRWRPHGRLDHRRRAALEEWDDLRELTAIERGQPDDDEDEL